jgi:hypothetical protein
MRFMMIVKANKDSEAGAPPNPELMAAVAKLAEGGHQGRRDDRCGRASAEFAGSADPRVTGKNLRHRRPLR